MTALVALGAMAFILACNDNKFLTERPFDFIGPANFYNNAGDAQAAINGVYADFINSTRRQLLRPQLRHARRAHDGDVDVAPRRDERAHAAGRLRDSGLPRLRPVDLGVGVRRDQSRQLRARSRADHSDGHGASQPDRRRGEVPAGHALLQPRASVRRCSAQAARDAGPRQPRDPAQHARRKSTRRSRPT